jgi:hypothetical protein
MTVRRHTTRLGALAAAGLLAAGMITALTGPAAHAAKPKAKPATGTVASGCNLQPFNSDFDYTAKTSFAAKKLPIVVTGLTFDLASFGVSGTCAPESGATLSKLKVG